jgi:hypothetical protein
MSDSCKYCGVSEWTGQFEDRFDMPAEHLNWNDGPLDGIAICKACGSNYAFQCVHNIWNTLLHWKLIKVPGPKLGDADEEYEDDAKPATVWLSIVDDQRPGRGQCVAVWLANPPNELNWYISARTAKSSRE